MTCLLHHVPSRYEHEGFCTNTFGLCNVRVLFTNTGRSASGSNRVTAGSQKAETGFRVQSLEPIFVTWLFSENPLKLIPDWFQEHRENSQGFLFAVTTELLKCYGC